MENIHEKLTPSLDKVRLPATGAPIPARASGEPLGPSKPLFPRIER